jgi:hypothetical protein
MLEGRRGDTSRDNEIPPPLPFHSNQTCKMKIKRVLNILSNKLLRLFFSERSLIQNQRFTEVRTYGTFELNHSTVDFEVFSL